MKRLKAKIILFIAAVLLATGMFFLLSVHSSRNLPAAPEPVAAHFYKNPGISIADARIKAFYVVPKDRNQSVDVDWKNNLAAAFSKIAAFHELQFHGASRLGYDIFPKPVLLEKVSAFYNSTSTQGGNPHGLVAVAEEIGRRVFSPAGDLYDAAFIKFNKDDYPVMGLIYEGVGASGGPIYEGSLGSAMEVAKELGFPEGEIYKVGVESVRGLFILNRTYFGSALPLGYGETVLYHEFAHTIGLPDEYNDAGRPLSDDVMGGGLDVPIGSAHIDPAVLSETGIVVK